jgi:hypothetical protein
MSLACFGAEARFFDVVFFADFFGDFLGDFFGDFLGAFVTPVFFFAIFFAAFLAFCVPRLLVFARFFSADALVVGPRSDLRAFFALRFLTVFFLAVATTISFVVETGLSG